MKTLNKRSATGVEREEHAVTPHHITSHHTAVLPARACLACGEHLGPLTQEEDECHEEESPPRTAQVEADN